MALKAGEDTKTLFSISDTVHTKADAEGQGHHKPQNLAKKEDGHDSEDTVLESVKPLAPGTFKRDPANRDQSKVPDTCTLDEGDNGNPEVVEVVAPTTCYQLPRTQSRYMNMALDIEPSTGGRSLNDHSSPVPVLDDHHEPTMEGSNNLNQQSQAGDDVPDDMDTVQMPFIKPEPLDDGINLRPAKRIRYLLDAVEVPTLASVYGPRRIVPVESEVKYDERIGKFTNPKVKRKQDYVLLPNTVEERMRGITKDLYPIPLDAASRSVMVTRIFLSTVYGGNSQMTFPTIRQDKLAAHGLNDFMCLNLDLNPYAPEVPGARGLFFAPGASDQPAEEWGQVQRVITRVESGKWHYVGQYRLAPVPSLTKDEWASQGAKVRNAWAREICKKGWGRDTLARIYLRKTMQRDFTEADLDQEHSYNRKYDIYPEEVGQAFLRGEESLAVWTMECIDYDVDFQLNLVQKYPSFVPSPPKQKKATRGKKAGKKMNQKPTAGQKRAGEKRKRIEVESSDEEEDDNPPEEESDFEEEVLVYTPRGTRSRPINIL